MIFCGARAFLPVGVGVSPLCFGVSGSCKICNYQSALNCLFRFILSKFLVSCLEVSAFFRLAEHLHVFVSDVDRLHSVDAAVHRPPEEASDGAYHVAVFRLPVDGASCHISPACFMARYCSLVTARVFHSANLRSCSSLSLIMIAFVLSYLTKVLSAASIFIGSTAP